MKNGSKPILLAEDDQVDAMTVRRALNDLRVVNPLTRVENGEAALAYLRDPANPRPCLILLDLNMPVMGGIEFLHEAKQDPVLRRIPVIVLTTSQEDEDKGASFDLGVAGYMRKPVGYSQFVEMMRSIDAYWTVSEAPD